MPGRRRVERGDRDVGECGEHAGQDFGGQVDRQLLHDTVPPAICWTSIGPNVRAGLIEAPVVGCDRDDRGEHDQADGDAGEPGGGLAVDHAEDGEHEDERTDELGGEGLADADRVGVGGDPEADVAGRWPSTPMMAAAPMIAPTTWAAM